MADDRPERSPGDLDFNQAFGGFFKGIGGIIAAFANAVETVSAPRSVNESTLSREWQANTDRQPTESRRPWVIAPPEPLIDLFDEGREILLVAELPGVYLNEVQAEVQDDILTLRVTSEQRWEREILLPALVAPGTLRWRLRNGILELSVLKLGAEDSR